VSKPGLFTRLSPFDNTSSLINCRTRSGGGALWRVNQTSNGRRDGVALFEGRYLVSTDRVGVAAAIYVAPPASGQYLLLPPPIGGCFRRCLSVC